MKNIYTYVAKDGYAARVQDTKSYDAIRYAIYLTLPLGWLICPVSARTSCQDGHSPSSLITTTQARTRTNTGEETSIFPGMAPSFCRGKLSCPIALSPTHGSQDVYGWYKYIDRFAFPDI
jgi:hypothetical protein